MSQGKPTVTNVSWELQLTKLVKRIAPPVTQVISLVLKRPQYALHVTREATVQRVVVLPALSAPLAPPTTRPPRRNVRSVQAVAIPVILELSTVMCALLEPSLLKVLRIAQTVLKEKSTRNPEKYSATTVPMDSLTTKKDRRRAKTVQPDWTPSTLEPPPRTSVPSITAKPVTQGNPGSVNLANQGATPLRET